jgi:hypothetical protein
MTHGSSIVMLTICKPLNIKFTIIEPNRVCTFQFPQNLWPGKKIKLNYIFLSTQCFFFPTNFVVFFDKNLGTFVSLVQTILSFFIIFGEKKITNFSISQNWIRKKEKKYPLLLTLLIREIKSQHKILSTPNIFNENPPGKVLNQVMWVQPIVLGSS